MQVKKILTAVALSTTLVFGGAAACNDQPPTEYHPLEWPDCDEDDRKGVWDTMDCGPSPAAPKVRTPAPSLRKTPGPKPSRR